MLAVFICQETRRRIKLSVWAYAYEVENVSIVPDYMYDFESNMVNLATPTKRPDLDFWFNCNFSPCTGMWIHKHPELDKIKKLYMRYYRGTV